MMIGDRLFNSLKPAMRLMDHGKNGDKEKKSTYRHPCHIREAKVNYIKCVIHKTGQGDQAPSNRKRRSNWVVFGNISHTLHTDSEHPIVSIHTSRG